MNYEIIKQIFKLDHFIEIHTLYFAMTSLYFYSKQFQIVYHTFLNVQLQHWLVEFDL